MIESKGSMWGVLLGKYQISVKETKEKLKYVKELLKSNLSAEDKEKVQISLFSYLSILNASTNVQLTNFLNQITKGKFSKRNSRMWKCCGNTSKWLY